MLEAPGGAIVGIEVKAAAKVGAGHFKGLEALREALPFGHDLWALPIHALWSLGTR